MKSERDIYRTLRSRIVMRLKRPTRFELIAVVALGLILFAVMLEKMNQHVIGCYLKVRSYRTQKNKLPFTMLPDLSHLILSFTSKTNEGYEYEGLVG